jgi:hypothetical protein
MGERLQQSATTACATVDRDSASQQNLGDVVRCLTMTLEMTERCREVCIGCDRSLVQQPPDK